MEIINYSCCPVCGSSDLRSFLRVKDHSVSGQFFEINECGACTARFTQGAPDPQSIGRYYQSSDYISHSNTREGLVNQLYHQVRRITLEQKRKLVQHATGLKTGSLLDVGAGTGMFVHTMQKTGWSVTGLEPDEQARSHARQVEVILQEPGALFSLEPASFDAITLWHVLEHVHDLHKYLDQFKLLLKQTARLIIAVPNYTAHDAQHYGAWWAAYDVPRHLYHFSPASMKRLLQEHGFSLKAIQPQWFDSFYVSLLSEKYKKGKSRLLHGAWEGLRSNLAALRNHHKCSSLVYIAEPQVVSLSAHTMG